MIRESRLRVGSRHCNAEGTKMTVDESLEQLITAAPVYENASTPDLAGVYEAFSEIGVSPEDVVAVSQCQFGTANIEALVDDDTIAFVYPTGILCTSGKRKFIGKNVKYSEVKFAQCRAFAPCEYTDRRGFGKYGIEFGGPGNVLLGRVYWRWKAKRFKDSTREIMVVAEERDRIFNVVNEFLG